MPKYQRKDVAKLDSTKQETCFFTGHRSIPKDKMTSLTADLDKTIGSLVSEGIDTFVCGGAVGFDTLAACRVIVAKKYFPHISLHLILPCRDQTARWRSSYDVALYQRIKGLADRVTYAADTYTSGCMHLRNRMMADASSVCIAYYNGGAGGTAYTVRYATDKAIRLINLYK